MLGLLLLSDGVGSQGPFLSQVVSDNDVIITTNIIVVSCEILVKLSFEYFIINLYYMIKKNLIK